MKELLRTEFKLREEQGYLGSALIVSTGIAVIMIGVIPIIAAFLDGNLKVINIIMSESYLRLIMILSIPLIIGLTAGIILIKSSVSKIAKSFNKAIEALIEEDLKEDVRREGQNNSQGKQ